MKDREFIQKRFTVRLKHRFEKDRLVYNFSDFSGEIEFSPRYETILITESFKLLIREKRARTFAIRLVIAAGLVTLSIAILRPDSSGLMGACVLLAALGFVLADRLGVFSTKCTMLKMEPAPPGAGKLGIRVMQDEQHDEIIAELKARWMARLRQLHLKVNPLNAPQAEQAKFNWLRDNSVISEEEYQSAVDQLRSSATRLGEPPATVPTLN